MSIYYFKVIDLNVCDPGTNKRTEIEKAEQLEWIQQIRLILPEDRMFRIYFIY